MRHVTTNIRLPEDLWRALKMQAAREGKRMAEIIRERLVRYSAPRQRGLQKRKLLRGLWKGVSIPDRLIAEAKNSLYAGRHKF